MKKNLKDTLNKGGDLVSRTFLKALVMLIGGYREALRFKPREKITFDKEAFIRTRPTPMQPFLQKMLHLQIFHQFIEDRLKMLNDGEGFSDEFEFELNMYEDRSGNKLRNQYDKCRTVVKKEGGALLKSVNPAVKSAYKQVKHKSKQVKDKSKRAYHDLRLKFQEIQKGERPTQGSHSMIKHSFEEKAKDFALKAKLKESSSNFKKYTNGTINQRSDPFFKDEEVSLSITAPEASSEDSDIDSNHENELDLEEFRYNPVDTDLMGDLEDIITGYSVKCSTSGYSSPQSSSSNSQLINFPIAPPRKQNHLRVKQSSKLQPQSQAPQPPPPPPPPSSSSSSSSSQSHSENLLIQLDSGQDNLETILDPLLEKPKLVNSLSQLNSSSIDHLAPISSIQNSYQLIPNLSMKNEIFFQSDQNGLQSKNLLSNKCDKNALNSLDDQNYFISSTNPFKTYPNQYSDHHFQTMDDTMNPNNVIVRKEPAMFKTNPFQKNWQQFE